MSEYQMPTLPESHFWRVRVRSTDDCDPSCVEFAVDLRTKRRWRLGTRTVHFKRWFREAHDTPEDNARKAVFNAHMVLEELDTHRAGPDYYHFNGLQGATMSRGATADSSQEVS